MSHVASKMLSCPMSNKRDVLFRITICFLAMAMTLCRMSVLRKGHVAVSNLGVESHTDVVCCQLFNTDL